MKKSMKNGVKKAAKSSFFRPKTSKKRIFSREKDTKTSKKRYIYIKDLLDGHIKTFVPGT
jgi:hypothetical protein